MREFVIYRCHDDGHEIFRIVEKYIYSHTESDAQQWVENEERCNPFADIWFEVEENMEFKQWHKKIKSRDTIMISKVMVITPTAGWYSHGPKMVTTAVGKTWKRK